MSAAREPSKEHALTDEDAQNTAARVRAARSYADLTQEQLAERVGVDKQTVKRWENAESRYVPDAGRRIAIAAVCHVPPEFLEHGFGDIAEPEIRQRLERIEAALAGGDLQPVRDYARAVISELRAGPADDAAGAPTPGRGPDRSQADRRAPRAQSPRRS